MTNISQINKDKLPKHIAIIMDGNGRWAEEQEQDRIYGHYHGVKSVRTVVEAATELGIKYLTLYAFSTENWDRPKQEVDGLMTLFVETIAKEVPDLCKNNIKLHFIGDLKKMPEVAQKELQSSQQATQNNTGLNLIVALSYSSRWEILQAMQQIATQVTQGVININDITEQTIKDNLVTKNFPDPELMIRTSGEYRISNFLLYQCAYTELYFTNTLWPAFGKENLYEAILDYQNRERRFGKTGKQIKTEI